MRFFPKLPCHVREYHKHWERNARIKAALRKMKGKKAMWDSFLEQTAVPEEVEKRRREQQMGKEMNMDSPQQYQIAVQGQLQMPMAQIPNFDFRWVNLAILQSSSAPHEFVRGAVMALLTTGWNQPPETKSAGWGLEEVIERKG